MKTKQLPKKQINRETEPLPGRKETLRLRARAPRLGALAIIIITVISLLWCFGVYPFRKKTAYLEFIVQPVARPVKMLEIGLTVYNPSTDSKVFTLCKGGLKPFDLLCKNERDRNLEIYETDDAINIIAENSRSIKLFYRVNIAQPGKHGNRGEYYDDLLTFDGEEAFLLPPAAASGDEQAIKKYIGRITVRALLPTGWVSVIPFAKKAVFKSEAGNTHGLITDINAPNWAKIYDLVKSAYTFGKLTKHPCPGEKSFSIYVDAVAQKFYTSETLTGLKSIYDFYAKLFGYKIPFSVVLLRKDPVENTYLIGGSSTQTLATTFDPDNARDWELMGHRFGHAFFDYKITVTKFHTAPQLWFYEGLVTYYENMAMSSLPEQLRGKLGLDVSQGFLALFRRYLYMRLKNPGLFAITPMSEESINSSGQIEFLHYTQAPLIIKYMEDLSFLKSGVHDRALKFILYNKPEEYNLQSIFTFMLDEKTSDFAQKYLFSADILPLWHLAAHQKEDSNQVISELNDFEHTLWTWFRLENANYKKGQPQLEGLAQQAAQAESLGLKFADDNIEAQVRQVSPTIYHLLKQHALQARK